MTAKSAFSFALYIEAGQTALQRAAISEAISHLMKGLEVLAGASDKIVDKNADLELEPRAMPP
jgi:predicted ATPase